MNDARIWWCWNDSDYALERDDDDASYSSVFSCCYLSRPLGISCMLERYGRSLLSFALYSVQKYNNEAGDTNDAEMRSWNGTLTKKSCRVRIHGRLPVALASSHFTFRKISYLGAMLDGSACRQAATRLLLMSLCTFGQSCSLAKYSTTYLRTWIKLQFKKITNPLSARQTARFRKIGCAIRSSNLCAKKMLIL